MIEPTHINSDLLASYLAGEASAEQRAIVEAWVAQSPANAAEFDRMQRIWSMTVDAAAIARDAEARAWAMGADAEAKAMEAGRHAWTMGAGAAARAMQMEDRAWARVSARIAEAEGAGRVIPLRRTHWQRWAAAAAIVAVLLLVRWLVQPEVQRFASAADAVSATLSDGSAVVLLPGSELEARMGDERAVELRGAAYFEVKRDEAKPFIVDAGEVVVTVLGTAFEVSAHDSSATVEVRVRSGRVRVQAGADTLVLMAGQHARYDKKRHFLERKAAPPAEVWGNRILQFEGAPLDQVMSQIERIYQVKVALGNPALARCKLTAEFDDEPVERILRVIADTFGLELRQDDASAYTLEGDGC